MKIVLSCKVYPTIRAGGMGFVCQDRARALVKDGHEVHVLTTGRGLAADDIEDDCGVQVHHLVCDSARYSGQFVSQCEGFCKAYCPDILHFDSFGIDHRHWWKSRPGNPKQIAVTMHGFCWGAYFTRWNIWMREGGVPPELNANSMAAERDAICSFDVQIGISRHEHWQLRDLMGIFNAKLVYNPIAEYFFEGLTPRPDNKRFLCAAVSGQRERGFHLAQQAANQCGAELVVTSKVPRREMPALIDSCCALVLPTAYAQGCDLAVGEALLRNRPVIVCATGSYLRDSEVGGIYHGALKLVPLGNPAALADAMLSPLIMCDGYRQQLHKHHPDTHVEKWLEAIL